MVVSTWARCLYPLGSHNGDSLTDCLTNVRLRDTRRGGSHESIKGAEVVSPRLRILQIRFTLPCEGADVAYSMRCVLYCIAITAIVIMIEPR